MIEPVEYLETATATKDDFRPDWSLKCSNCEASPIVPLSGLCGPCHFGAADTLNGEWWTNERTK